MNKPLEQTCQRYIEEIRVWQQASQLHARKAIEQYQRMTRNLEAFDHERRRHEAVLNQLTEGICIVDAQGEIILWNQVMAELFKLSHKQAVGQLAELLLDIVSTELAEMLHQARHGDQDHLVRRGIDIAQRTFTAKLNRVRLDETHYWVLLLEDITHEEKLARLLKKERDMLEARVEDRTRQLQKMVRTDPLTELLNRHGFQHALEETLSHAKAYETPFALLFIDLDGFKAINDALGHHAGDTLLKEMARRMRALVRQQDVVARLAGDEFAIVLNGLSDEAVVRRIAQKLVDSLSEPVCVDQEHQARVSASIGVYLHMSGEYDASRVLSMADHAMYEAKRRGKKRHVIFKETMWDEMAQSQSLAMQLEAALERRAFQVFVQPICRPDGTIVSAEALARWQHEGEWISPGVFIPLLEKRGLIDVLTYQIIEQVIEALTEDATLPCISINLSLQQFYDEHFIDWLEALVERHPEVCGRLGFEITESLLNSDMNRLRRQLAAMRAMGLRISIDDFGTGYSSFAYMRDFPADVLKIDRSFVVDIEYKARDLNLLAGMVALASALDLHTVIEGVETEEQVRRLEKHLPQGNFHIQGFVFHRPFPLVEWHRHFR